MPLPAPDAGPIVLREPGIQRPEVLVIGSSTGGPQALFTLLGDLKSDIKMPVLITQHMPATFTTILAEHITRMTRWPCTEAKDGETVQAGRIYLAPGDFHMLVNDEAGKKVITLDQGEPVNFCRPAIDPMLETITKAYNGHVLTTILTGMGADGLNSGRGLTEAGGTVFAQDEETSVVWGMPGAVAAAGLCSAVLPLKELGPRIVGFLTRGRL